MNFISNLNTYLSSEFIDSLIQSLDEERTNSLILNTCKISENNFLKMFPNVIKHDFLPNVFYYLKNEYQFGKSFLMFAGCYYIIDASSAIVSSLLNIKDGDYVLDLCSAPGGKTISLLFYNKDKNFEVISNDLSHSRALELSKNIERIGASNVIVTNNDFSRIKNNYLESFDKIILDAPCSGSAMFRKNELSKLDWSIEKVLSLQKIQISLLEDAIDMLKEGGTIVYSTCSFSKEENEDVVLDILSKHPEIHALPIFDNPSFFRDSSLKESIHLFPNLYKGEGQFIALLKKDGESIKRIKEPKLEKAKYLKDFNLNFKREIILKDKVYATNNLLNLKPLNLIRPGLAVCEINKKVLIPSFHLSHYLTSIDSIALTENELKLYLHGEQINKDVKRKTGFYPVSYASINIGFVKLVNNNLKNYYPKGLRH